MPQVSAIVVAGGLYKSLLASRKYWVTLLQVWQGWQLWACHQGVTCTTTMPANQPRRPAAGATRSA